MFSLIFSQDDIDFDAIGGLSNEIKQKLKEVRPETVAQAHFGFLAGTPVDAYVCALGPDAGYVTAFKSQRTQMAFISLIVK